MLNFIWMQDIPDKKNSLTQVWYFCWCMLFKQENYIVNIKGEAGCPMKEVLDLNRDEYLFKSQQQQQQQKNCWLFKFYHHKILPLFFHWDCPVVITLIPLKTGKKEEDNRW